VTVTVTTGAIHGLWTVVIGAPDGRRLEPGTYDDVARIPGPGQAHLEVTVEHRGCGETYGSFTVHDIAYGSRGYVESLDATFIQHCEEPTAPALRGEVHVTAPPRPPDPLEVDVTFAPGRTTLGDVRKVLTLHGTIMCSRRARGHVRAMVEEVGPAAFNAAGNGVGVGAIRVDRCSTTPTQWVLDVESVNGNPFTGGASSVQVTASSRDEWWTAYMQRPVFARDAVSTKDPIPTTPTTDDGASGITGLVTRHSVAAVLIVLGFLIPAVLATVAVTRLAARRRTRL